MFRALLTSICFILPFICNGYDVMGVGAPCVDFVVNIDEGTLKHLPGNKGDSTLVGWEEFMGLLSVMPSEERFVLTGGCCANTIKGLSSLNEKTSLCGRIGSDPMSAYFMDVIQKLDITPLFTLSQKPIQQVVSLVTPDSQRTCYCFLGATNEFHPSDIHDEDFKNLRLVYIEGYALHHPGVVEQAIFFAKKAGAKVAMDLNSMRVISHFKKQIFDLISNDIDIVFCNQDEIDALTGLSPAEGAKYLSTLCPIAVVMAGEQGCWIGTEGASFLCPGFSVPVVDTTGAGDLFAAGFLHGILQNQSLKTCGHWGNLVGSTVVQQIGAEIPVEKWDAINASMTAKD